MNKKKYFEFIKTNEYVDFSMKKYETDEII